jgi:hypothetical protein
MLADEGGHRVQYTQLCSEIVWLKAFLQKIDRQGINNLVYPPVGVDKHAIIYYPVLLYKIVETN